MNSIIKKMIQRSTFRPRRDLNLHLLQSLMFTGKDTEVQRGELTCPGLWLDYGRTETRSHFTLTYYLILWGKEKRLPDEGGKIDVLYFLLPSASQAEGGHLSYSTSLPASLRLLYSSPCLYYSEQSTCPSVIQGAFLQRTVLEDRTRAGLSLLGMAFQKTRRYGSCLQSRC